MLLLVLGVRLALDWSYLTFVITYQGFEADWDLLRLSESYWASLVLAMIVPRRFDRPSDFFIAVLILAIALPNHSYYAWSGGSRVFFFALLASIGVIALTRNSRFRVPPGVRGLWKPALIGCLASVVFVAAWLAKAGAGRLFNLDLSRVYEYREIYNTEVAVGLFSYFSRWAYKVFIVALMAWSLFQRWHFVFVGLALLTLGFFAISSHKQIAIYPFVVLIVFLVVPKRHAGALTVAGMLGVILSSMGTYVLTGMSLAPGFLIRRLFYLPARLNFAYHEFFSENGFIYMANTMEFAWLGEYHFDKPPPLLISDWMGMPGAWANNGFLASAYMNFGYVGMAIFAVLTGLLLRCVDSMVVGKMPVWFGTSVVVVPFISLFLGSDFLTALVGGGLLVSMLLLWTFSAGVKPLRLSVAGLAVAQRSVHVANP